MPTATQAWFGSFGANTTTPTFVVPANVDSLDVIIGGASGGGTQNVGHPAGWGPLFTAKLAVTPGETLYMQVGSQGTGNGAGGPANGSGRGIAGWPDGGAANSGPGFNKGGGGGGSTRIWRNGIGTDLLIVVAGGGGVGYANIMGSPNPGLGNGLAPAGETTINGPTEGRGYNVASTGGRPGSAGAGGVAGTGGGSPTNGVSFHGGNGGTGVGITGVLVGSGGGGGGGYYGGGGGATAEGQGGGGMSYIDLSEGWSETLWDLTKPLTVGFNTPSRGGSIRFTWAVPGGWSLGLRSILG